MSKPTPGPWKATFRTVTAAETDERLGFTLKFFNGNADDARANCRLIAAAPDLLAALEGVLRVADRKTDEFDAARAAIAKALGAPLARFRGDA